MPVYTSSIEVTADYPTIKPSLNLNFARSRALDPRITFTRASVGTYVGRDGLIKTAGNDEARFDHDPDTLESLGLLIEDSRTNRFLYSDLSTVDTTSNATTSRTTGLDGNTTSALNVTFTSGSGAFVLSASSPISASTEYTFSVWIKKVSGSTTGSVYSYVAGGTDGVLSGQIYNTDGQHLGQAPTGVWKRYSKTFTTSAGSTAIRVTMPGYDSNGLNIHYFGAQIEEGAILTSYIPTTSAAVTRARDIAAITGKSFSSWYNRSESTFVVESTRQPLNSGKKYFTIDDITTSGTLTELVEMATQQADKVNIYSYVNSANQSDIRVTPAGSGKFKAAAALALNDVQISVDGVLGTPDTTALYPSKCDRMNIGAYISANYAINAPIAKLSYYPKRLTNAQLQLLTS